MLVSAAFLLLAAAGFVLAEPAKILAFRAVSVYEFMDGPLPDNSRLYVIQQDSAAGHGFVSYLVFDLPPGTPSSATARLHLYVESAEPGGKLVVGDVKGILPERPSWSGRPEAGVFQKERAVEKAGAWLAVEVPAVPVFELSGEGNFVISGRGGNAPWLEIAGE